MTTVLADFLHELRRRALWPAALLITVLAALSAPGVAWAKPPATRLPPGVIAVVRHVPRGLGTLTRGELHRAIAQTSAQEGRSRPPRQASLKYEQIERIAFDDLLESADLQGEAIERGTVITEAEVSKEIARIKQEDFKGRGAYRRFLRENKLTAAEARESVKLQLLAKRFEAEVTKGVKGPFAKLGAFLKFARNYLSRWRARTTCAPSLATERCSNGPLVAEQYF